MYKVRDVVVIQPNITKLVTYKVPHAGKIATVISVTNKLGNRPRYRLDIASSTWWLENQLTLFTQSEVTIEFTL